MTNNTINVPRELLENIVLCYNEGEFELGTLAAECHALLSAPSPAGVDGLETIGYATESELAQLLDPTMPTGKYVRIGLDHPTCWKEDAPYEHLVALCVLSDASAIIDGLRGEVERLQRAEKNDAIAYKAVLERQDEIRTERDQQAQRIGELEGLLRHAQKQVPTGSGLHMRIDAALSAVCAAAPNIATTSEHKVPEGIVSITRSLGRAIVRFNTSEQLNEFYRAAKSALPTERSGQIRSTPR